VSRCPSFAALSTLIDGGLGNENELAVRRHLDVCAACVQAVETITALKRAVGRAYECESPPPVLRRAVIARYGAHRLRWHGWVGVIAATLLATISEVAAGGRPSNVPPLTTTLVTSRAGGARREPCVPDVSAFRSAGRVPATAPGVEMTGVQLFTA
jgi:anti-sigma factor RsiW